MGVDIRRVVAMGGGGFSMEPENLLLDEFVLTQARTSRPRVCFVPTASGDSDGYVARFYRAFSTLDCRPADLQLFKRSIRDLESFVLMQDVIYVGGGNTANLLAVWRAHGLDRILRRAWQEGVVLCGLSAGMNWRRFVTAWDSCPGVAARTTTGRNSDGRCSSGWSLPVSWLTAGQPTTVLRSSSRVRA
jgi:cyanophycinase-like exopeptidase